MGCKSSTVKGGVPPVGAPGVQQRITRNGAPEPAKGSERPRSPSDREPVRQMGPKESSPPVDANENSQSSRIESQPLSREQIPLRVPHKDSSAALPHDERREESQNNTRFGQLTHDMSWCSAVVKHPSSGALDTKDKPTNVPASPSNNQRREQEEEHQHEVDEKGNVVVLPKGEWIRTAGTPFYYSEAENLYFHPPSCQFYDPTNEMWYDPEKDEWYQDE
ncbi:hypothetical protein ERJ75_001441900 [Trypanosoma vivax]|nr:hypothetical protein TRVL_08893 [Trypanosoma vivax]KAH8607042.1 hypothetical protein ERJ75_001441900 [Trypanosoma vivax]